MATPKKPSFFKAFENAISNIGKSSKYDLAAGQKIRDKARLASGTKYVDLAPPPPPSKPGKI